MSTIMWATLANVAAIVGTQSWHVTLRWRRRRRVLAHPATVTLPAHELARYPRAR